MAVWQKAFLTGLTPGSRITINDSGQSWVKILSPSFRLNDGVDYTFVGWGNVLIAGPVEEGGSTLWLWMHSNL